MDDQAARLSEQVAQFILQLRSDNASAVTPAPSATREYTTDDLSLRRVTAACVSLNAGFRPRYSAPVRLALRAN